MRRLTGLVLALSSLAGPCLAADYYVAARYQTQTGDGEAALLVNDGSIHDKDGGVRLASLVQVNAGNQTVSSYASEMDCAAKSWRVTSQTDYDSQGRIGGFHRVPQTPPAFAPVAAGSPAAEALAFVCGWPGAKAGAAKVTARDEVSLAALVAPTLKLSFEPDNDGPPRAAPAR
jgi:hypothetical protein